MLNFEDRNKWSIRRGVQVLPEHQRIGGDVLREIARNNNERVSPSVVVFEKDNLSDINAPERPCRGFAFNWRVENTDDPKVQCLICDIALFKKYERELEKRTKVIPEVWLERKGKADLDPVILLEPGDTDGQEVILKQSRSSKTEIRSVALLGGSTPKRDLSTIGFRYGLSIRGSVPKSKPRRYGKVSHSEAGSLTGEQLSLAERAAETGDRTGWGALGDHLIEGGQTGTGTVLSHHGMGHEHSHYNERDVGPMDTVQVPEHGTYKYTLYRDGSNLLGVVKVRLGDRVHTFNSRLTKEQFRRDRYPTTPKRKTLMNQVQFDSDYDNVNIDELIRYERGAMDQYDGGDEWADETTDNSSDDPLLARFFQSKQWRELCSKLEKIEQFVMTPDEGDDYGYDDYGDSQYADDSRTMPGNPNPDMGVIAAAAPRRRMSRRAILDAANDLMDRYEVADGEQVSRLVTAVSNGVIDSRAVKFARGQRIEGNSEGAAPIDWNNTQAVWAYANAIAAGRSQEQAIQLSRRHSQVRRYARALSDSLPPLDSDGERDTTDTNPAVMRAHLDQETAQRMDNIRIGEAAALLSRLEGARGSIQDKVRWSQMPEHIRNAATEVIGMRVM